MSSVKQNGSYPSRVTPGSGLRRPQEADVISHEPSFVSASTNLGVRAAEVALDPQGSFRLKVLYNEYRNQLKLALIGGKAERRGSEAVDEQLLSGLGLSLNGKAVTLNKILSAEAFELTADSDLIFSCTNPPHISLSLHGSELCSLRYNSTTSNWIRSEQQRPLFSFDYRNFLTDAEYRKRWSQHSSDRTYRPLLDLHTHYTAQVSARSLVRAGVRADSLYPVELLDRLEISYPNESLVDRSGQQCVGLKKLFQHLEQSGKASQLLLLVAAMNVDADKLVNFHETERCYEYRSPIAKDIATFPELLHEIARDYRRSGIRYAELELSDIATPEWSRAALQNVDRIEQLTGVKLRFKGTVWRFNTPEDNKVYLDRLFAEAERNWSIVGTDFVGYEVNSFRDILDSVKYAIDYRDLDDPTHQVDVHACETPYFDENLSLAIEAGVNKVGHARYGVTDEVLTLARERGTILALLPNPNKTIDFPELLETKSFFDSFPIKRALAAGVRVTLGTDGAGLYRSGSGVEPHIAALCGLHFQEFLQIAHSDVAYLKSRHHADLVRRARIEDRTTSISYSSSEVIPGTKSPSEDWLHRALDGALGSRQAPFVTLEVLRQDSRMAKYLEFTSGTWERFSVYEHSHMATDRLTKYPELRKALEGAQVDNRFNFGIPEFCLMLAIHDVGKYDPDQPDFSDDKSVQLRRVGEIFDLYREQLPITDEQAEFTKILIANDYVADFIKRTCPGRPSIQERGFVASKILDDNMSIREYHETIDRWEGAIEPLDVQSNEFQTILDETVAKVKQLAETIDVQEETLHRYAKLFHACNASAFSPDAAFNGQRGFPSLDILYQRNPNAQSFDDQLFLLDDTELAFVYSEALAPAVAALDEALQK